jgi:peptidoglycan/LPS O-acetylase OafA/YrhL
VRRFLLLRLGRLYPLHLATSRSSWRWSACAGRPARGLLQLDAPAFSENSPKALAANLLLVHAVGPMWPTFNPPSWSISTEFWAYVLFAGVVIALRTGRQFLAGAVALMGGATALLSHGRTPLLRRFAGGCVAGGTRCTSAGTPARRRCRWRGGRGGRHVAPGAWASSRAVLRPVHPGDRAGGYPTVHPSLQWLGKVSYSLLYMCTRRCSPPRRLIHGVECRRRRRWAGDALVLGYVARRCCCRLDVPP